MYSRICIFVLAWVMVCAAGVRAGSVQFDPTPTKSDEAETGPGQLATLFDGESTFLTHPFKGKSHVEFTDAANHQSGLADATVDSSGGADLFNFGGSIHAESSDNATSDAHMALSESFSVTAATPYALSFSQQFASDGSGNGGGGVQLFGPQFSLLVDGSFTIAGNAPSQTFSHTGVLAPGFYSLTLNLDGSTIDSGSLDAGVTASFSTTTAAPLPPAVWTALPLLALAGCFVGWTMRSREKPHSFGITRT
jgi:hypothetical protein